MQLESSVTLFDDTKVEDRFAELQITADGITSEVSRKVGNDEVISRINQSAEGIQIQANKVNIEGATIFSSGRLSQSSLDSAYDASGAATGAVNNLKSDLSSSSGTTVINGGHIATGTLSAGAVNASSGTFDTANIPNLSANKIVTDTINIARIPATARNDTYITDIGSDGIRVHDSHTTNNSIVINSSGMDVVKGGDSVAKFGASVRVGRNDDKHIEIKNNAFNVYDEDGSAPFSVYTGSSLQSVTRQRYSTVGANTTTYHQIKLIGTIPDNKIYFGVSASGKPSSMTQYIENPSAEEWKYLTISGVQFGVKIISASVIQVMVKNNNTAKRYYGQQYNETYYETSVKVNDAMLDTQQSAMALIDTTGVSMASSLVYTYGKIATIVLSVYNTASVGSGGIIYKGTLLDFIPVADMKIVGVIAPDVFGGIITSDGTIYVYNTTGGALSISASAPITLTATYIYK